MLKLNKKTYIASAIILLMLAGALVATPMILNRGENASKVMNSQERELLKKLESFKSASTYKTVVAVLGEPTRARTTYRARWRGLCGSSLDQITISFDFSDGKISSIQWFKLGKFYWDFYYY